MLSELLTELEVRRKDREAGFMTVARKLAAGEKVAAVTVERLLAETGKMPAELTEAVELFRRRFEWHEQRQRGLALEKERSAVQDRIAAEDRKLELAEKAHEQATSPLYGRLHEIREAVNQADDARRQLIATCTDTKLKAERAEIEGRLRRLQNESTSLRNRGELVKQADSDVETADRLTTGLVPGASTAHIDRLREQAARKREAGEKALAELAGVQRQIAALEREEATIYERMTKP